MPVSRQKNNKLSARSRRQKGPVAIALFILLVGIVISYVVIERVQENYAREFQSKADHTLDRASATLNNYGNLLFSGHAFKESSVDVTSSEWDRFYRAQRVFERYPGVNSVAYVEAVRTADIPDFEDRMQSQDSFGPDYQIKAVSARDGHAFISSYVSESDLSAVEGLDLTAQDSRYEVYEQARQSRSVTTSPVFSLATGYTGVFMLFPHFEQGVLDGYILTSFRIDDLMQELFSDTSLGYRVTDVTDTSTKLYQSSEWSEKVVTTERMLKMANRTWQVEVSGETSQPPRFFVIPAITLTASIVLAAAVYSLQRRR